MSEDRFSVVGFMGFCFFMAYIFEGDPDLWDLTLVVLKGWLMS